VASGSFHNLDPSSAPACCAVVFVPTVGSMASRTNAALFPRGSLGFIQGCTAWCGRGCLGLPYFCGEWKLWWNGRGGGVSDLLCVTPQMSMLASYLAHKPAPAAVAPLGSERAVSCSACSWHDRRDTGCVWFLLKTVCSPVRFRCDPYSPECCRSKPWLCSGPSPGDVCVQGVCVGLQSRILQLCLFQALLVSLRRQYPALLHQMTKPGPKLNF